MRHDTIFWQEMAQLINTNSIIVDRSKGKPHPRYPELIYPLDYGYLENTTAGDGDGIDVWLGSLNSKKLTGILCTFDIIKRDTEIKLLIGCTKEDVHIIQNFNDQILALFISNPLVNQ
jgi:inorganic pyrophosphatase